MKGIRSSQPAEELLSDFDHVADHVARHAPVRGLGDTMRTTAAVTLALYPIPGSRVVTPHNKLVHRVLSADPAAVSNLDPLPAFPFLFAAPRADTLKARCRPAGLPR